MDRREPTVNVVTTTRRKTLRCRPKGFGDRGQAVIDVLPSKGCRVTITVDKVLRARGKMLRNNANGPAELSGDGNTAVLTDGDSVRGGALVRQAVFKGECRAPEAWKILRLVFLKPDAGPGDEHIPEEWQEDRRTDLQPGMYRYNTAFMASLDVKTAVDVAKPQRYQRFSP